MIKFPFSISLGQKILIIIACYLFGVLTMFIISQKDLKTVSEKLGVIELAYSLNNVVLEVRRYEKNYFLYNTVEALESNRKHLKEGFSIIDSMEKAGPKLKAMPLFRRISKNIVDYREAMEALSTSRHQHDQQQHRQQ